MENETSKFDSLVKLHNEIKDFKLKNSEEIFSNFCWEQEHCFKKYIDEQKSLGNIIPHLSCTAICAYTLSQYCKMWKSENIKPKPEFEKEEEFYKHIEDPSKWSTTDPLRKPDEFTTINTLYLIRRIIDKKNDELLKIVRELCKRFLYDSFAIFEKPHPFIYYKFYRLITVWIGDISQDLINDREKGYPNWKNIGIQEIQPKYEKKFFEFEDKIFGEGLKKDRVCTLILDYFFDGIYERAKYELYRQISLYHAKDKTLFDVRRLIYSLLIAKERDRYSNNIIYEEALEIIFTEQHETGLFPIGHVINNDFIIDKKDGDNYFVKPGSISTRPIISSIECLNDLLEHLYVKEKLGDKYEPNFRKAYYWIMGSLKKKPDGRADPCVCTDPNDNVQNSDNPGQNLDPCHGLEIKPKDIANPNRRSLQGWYPEYESTHAAESWVAGYCLLFVKNYCEMLSRIIEEKAKSDLQAVDASTLKEKWECLLDSYNVKRYIGNMLKDDKCISALIFGPPGVGKSTIAKALANKLRWDYVEITPGRFLDAGDQNIIKKINEIFEKLNQLKNTVIFFDEVDQLVKSRGSNSESSDIWIVTALLPKLQELHGNKKIKFILATNHISRVDSAIKRPGRIDLVIPMGGICWKDRLHFLIKQIEKQDSDEGKLRDLKEELFESSFADIKDDLNKLNQVPEENASIKDKQLQGIKGKITKPALVNLLSNTNNMPYENIKYIIQELVEECSEKDYKNKSDIYKKYLKSAAEKKQSDIEKFDGSFRRESDVKEDQPPIPYHVIMRMPNEIEKLIQDDDESRFEYILMHVLDFCSFHEEGGKGIPSISEPQAG